MSDDLLEFGGIDVFYVLWERPDASYYLKDTTADLDHVEWTKNKRVACYFYTDQEAEKHARFFNKTRKGVVVECDERDILDDLDLDDLP